MLEIKPNMFRINEVINAILEIQSYQESVSNVIGYTDAQIINVMTKK